MIIPLFSVALFLLALKFFLTSKRPYLRLSANSRIREICLGCLTLRDSYTPTFWCFLGHSMTVFSAVMRNRRKRRFPYERETLPTPDGGCVSIDWAGKPKKPADDEVDTPVVVFVSGITNSSQAPYLVLHVKHFLEKGWACACYVYRGADDTEVRTPLLYYAAFTSDLELVVSHVREQYPKCPIFVFGVSLGGMISFNTVCKSQVAKDNVSAVLCLSMPWNPFLACKDIHSGINYYLYNKPIVRDLKKLAVKHARLLSSNGISQQLVEQLRTIKAYDQTVVARMGGYDSCEEYYTDSGPIFKLDQVETPVLAVNARDDPFSMPAGFPSERELSNCKSPIALLEYNFGGHVGFSTNLNLSDMITCRIASDFFENVLKYNQATQLCD